MGPQKKLASDTSQQLQDWLKQLSPADYTSQSRAYLREWKRWRSADEKDLGAHSAFFQTTVSSTLDPTVAEGSWAGMGGSSGEEKESFSTYVVLSQTSSHMRCKSSDNGSGFEGPKAFSAKLCASCHSISA